MGDRLREQVWGIDGRMACSGRRGLALRPPGIEGTPGFVLRLPDSGPRRARFLMALPSAQGVSGTLRTPGPGSLSAVTGLGGWESQLYAGACKATWGPGQLWHMQGTAVRPDRSYIFAQVWTSLRPSLPCPPSFVLYL